MPINGLPIWHHPTPHREEPGYLTPEEFKNFPVPDQRLIFARSSKRKGFYAKEFWGHQPDPELALVS